MKPAILIHGPTASGKTALSVALAERLNGEVVNADSMQVYADLRIISARPTEVEMQGTPHHLFGHIAGSERYSTGRWLEDARTIIADIERRGKTPIIIGGTGLYHMALTQGLSEIPPVSEDVRAEVFALQRNEGASGLYQRLMKHDPDMAQKLGPNDRQRLSRALEVFLASGQSISTFQNQKTRPALSPNMWLGVALTPPRARLYARIDRRFEGMLMEGAMEEAKALLAQNLPDDLPVMKAHGVPTLIAYLEGKMSAESAAETAKRDSRRYAKRQFTWIGRQFPFWPRIPSMTLDDRMRVILSLYREVDAP